MIRLEDVLEVLPAGGCSGRELVRRMGRTSPRKRGTPKWLLRLLRSGELVRDRNGLLRPGNETPTAAGNVGRNVASSSAKGQGRAQARATGGAEVDERTPERFSALVAACRGGVSFSALCDRLDLSPSKCSRLLESAKAAGVSVAVAHDTVGLHWRDPSDDIRQVAPAPAIGETYRCAVISDTHFGSRYAMRAQVADFVRHAYSEGCREVLCAGDVLDGCYRHGVFELTHSGLADQARDAAETLPMLPGLSYHTITGNHDCTFSERTGLDVGQAIVGAWSALGRNDLTCYGDRSAYLRVGGAVVHLWHPKKSGAYALSYLLQKQVERYSALKPQILIAGHWHCSVGICVRGVEAIAAPCFQGGESAFAKSLGGSPAIGGLILEWRQTEQGTIRDFAIRPRRYYEREAIVDVRNRVDGEMVEPARSVPIAVPERRWHSCTGAQ